MNNQIKKILGVTENDYRMWCKDTNRQLCKLSNKREFFARVIDGRLTKDPVTGKMIKKNRSQNG